MSNSITAPRTKAQLRSEAEFRLKVGLAESTDCALSVGTLQVLYKFASSPETAAEGLKLLHELQTHQVELDMQHKQLHENEQVLGAELLDYKDRFFYAPFGYLVINPDGGIVENNLAAAALLGFDRLSTPSQRIQSFFSASGAYLISSILKKLPIDSSSQSCIAECANVDGEHKRLHVSISLAPSRSVFLVAISDYDSCTRT